MEKQYNAVPGVFLNIDFLVGVSEVLHEAYMKHSFVLPERLPLVQGTIAGY